MKHIAIAISAAVLSLALPASGSRAQGQQAAQPQPAQQQQADHAQPGMIAIVPAADIVGRNVVDPHGASAGRIESLVLDMQNGAVEYVLIGGRGDFNLKGEVVAVPWSVLERPPAHGDISITMSANELLQSPRIDPELVYQLNTPGWRRRIYGYYGYGCPQGYYGSCGAYGPWYGAYPGNWYGYNRRYGLGQPQGAQKPSAQSQTTGSQTTGQSSTQSSAQGGATSKQAAASGQNGSGDSSDQGNGQPANALSIGRNGIVSTLTSPNSVSPSGLRSADVYALNGDIVGHIDQVLIDTRSGEVAYLLLERGGFLGLNPTWFALPVEALVWSPYQPNYGYRLTVNERRLNDVPPVPINRAHLPTHVSRRELAQLYRHFGIEPYWTRSAGPINRQGKSSSNGQQAERLGQAEPGHH